MNVFVGALFSLSIGIGGIIGWIRFKKIDPAFSPFVYLTWLAFLNEIVSISFMYAGYWNIINYNLFSLLEAVLITWQFYRWQLFSKKQKRYWALQAFFICFPIIESALTSFRAFNSYFIITHSFLIVLMSISMINKIVFTETTPLFRHPVFLICFGFIVYFTYSVLVESFWIFGLNKTRIFRLKIYQLLAYINLFINLIFALAILWIPMKQRYILQS